MRFYVARLRTSLVPVPNALYPEVFVDTSVPVDWFSLGSESSHDFPGTRLPDAGLSVTDRPVYLGSLGPPPVPDGGGVPGVPSLVPKHKVLVAYYSTQQVI